MSSLLLCLVLDIAAAEKALQADQPAEAIRMLGDLANSDDPRANEVLGRAYYKLRNYASAVEPLLIACDAKPQDKELARVTALACWGAAREGGSSARAYYADAIRVAKVTGDSGLLAPLHFESGEFEQALKHYRTLADTPAVRKVIADCLQGLGKTDDAVKAYGAALELAMEKRDLKIAYQSAFQSDRGGQLVKWLSAEIGKKDDAWARLYRGYAYANMQMDGDAVKDLRIAVKAIPQDRYARDLLCRALIRWGVQEQRPAALDEMERIARKLLEEGDEAGRTHLFWLASHAWLNRDVERSYNLLKELRTVDPTAKDVGLNFAAMARRLDRLDEAESAYKDLLEASPDDPDVLNDLGILADGAGDREAAIALWKRVLAEDPEDLNALENLFTAAWERGDAQEAARHLETGLRLARESGGGLEDRWNWFKDRLEWAGNGHG